MGQGGVGKTAMVLRYTTGDFNEQVGANSYEKHPKLLGDKSTIENEFVHTNSLQKKCSEGVVFCTPKQDYYLC